MEKEVNVENNKVKENNDIEITEKAAKFSDVGKEIISVSEPELTQEEEIASYPDEVASPEVKKALIEAVKKADKIVKPTDGGFSINTKKDEEKEMKKTLKRDVRSKPNVKIEEQEKHNDNKDEKVR
jgi:hypothetical protein